MPREQIGFQKGARTADHVFTLKTIIDKYVKKAAKQHLYVCFVDFKSAFDTISRQALFYKLAKLGVGGYFLKCMQSIYNQVNYCIKLPEGITDPFPSNVGVKQGCVLSPTLFNLFIHDLPQIFDETCGPVELFDTQLNCLMYADDLVIISQTAKGLQNALDRLSLYCDKWHLTVNIQKTKVLIFNIGGKLLTKHRFYYKQNHVELTSAYQYL